MNREEKIANSVAAGVADKMVTAEDVDLKRIRGYLLDIQDFVFRHRGSASPMVTGREIEELKSWVQRAIDLT
jgi:hypothetical protein